MRTEIANPYLKYLQATGMRSMTGKDTGERTEAGKAGVLDSTAWALQSDGPGLKLLFHLPPMGPSKVKKLL